MPVYGLERGEQALPPLAIEAADRSAQLVDRLREFRAFRSAGSLGSFQFLQFLRGDQIDRADPLTLGMKAVMIGQFGLGDADLGTGKAQFLRQNRRRTFEPLARQAVGFDTSLVGGLGAGDGGGAGFARSRQRLARLRRTPLGRAQPTLRFLLGTASLIGGLSQGRALIAQPRYGAGQCIGLRRKSIALADNLLGPRDHRGDPLGRLAGARAPALPLGIGRRLSFPVDGQGAIGQRLIRLQLADGAPRLLAGLRQGGDQRTGFRAIGHGGTVDLSLLMLALRTILVAPRFGQSFLDTLAPPRQPLQRRRRLIGGAQRSAQLLVGLRQGGASCGQRLHGRLFARLCPILRRRRLLDVRLHGRARGVDRLQPIQPDQPLGRRRPALYRDIAVPAAQLPVPRDQPLSDAQRLPFVPVHHANLRQTAGQFGRRHDMRGQRCRTSGQGGIARQRIRPGPAPLALRPDRRFQIVAQRGGERPLIARRRLQPIQCPRLAGATAIDRPLQRRRLAIERRQPGARRRQRRFGRRPCFGGGLAIRIGRLDRAFGGIALGLRFVLIGDRRLALRLQRGSIGQGGRFRSQSRHFPFGPIEPGARSHQCRLRHAQLRLLGRLRRHRLCKIQFGVPRSILGGGDPRGESRAQLLRFGHSPLQRRDLRRQPGDRIGRIIGQRPFARPIFLQPARLLRQVGQATDDRLPLGPQRSQPMPRLIGGIARILGGRASVGQRCHGRLRMGGGGHLPFLRGRHGRVSLFRLRPCSLRTGIGLAPAGEQHPSFGHPNLVRQADIAFRRPRLPPQRIGARVHIQQNLVQPGQIGLGRAQFLLGILAPDMQAGNARRFLQHRAPFLRPRSDDGGDPPLTDQRRAVRPGGGICEDQRHVLGAHILAIGSVGATRPALDPARDFQFAVRADIDGGKQLALFLDGEQRHFGKVALRPRGGAREDHILHATAAHGFGAGFAHHPPDRFQQVGFAAPIGADDAGQPRLDAQLRRIDEAFEAGEFEALYLHDGKPGQPATPVSLCVGAPVSPL